MLSLLKRLYIYLVSLYKGTPRRQWDVVDNQPDFSTPKDELLQVGVFPEYLWEPHTQKFDADLREVSERLHAKNQKSEADLQAHLITVDDPEPYIEFDELVDMWIRQNNVRFELSSGLASLNDFVMALGYERCEYNTETPLETFLKDNPGAIEALYEWVKDNPIQEWEESLSEEVYIEDEDDMMTFPEDAL